MPQPNCQSIRYCWEAEKVKTLIRLRAELSPLFTGKRNAAKYAWAVVERELNVPLPLAKIIKKWNNLLQEYKAIKLSEEPKRRDWPFFNMMDVYFSDQVNDPTLRLFSSTKTFGSDTLDDCDFKDSIGMSNAIAAANAITASIKRENSLNREYNNNNNTTSNNNNTINTTNVSDITDMMQDTKSIGSIDDETGSLNLITTNSGSAINRIESNNNNVTFNNFNNNGGSAYQDTYDDAMEQHHHHHQPAAQPHHQHHPNKIGHSMHDHTPIPLQQQHLSRHKDVSREELLQQAEHHNIDQYLLSWNNFYGNMCRGFHSLQKDEKMVDVTIAAGGKIFKAHKLVLSVCSPYFQKIFLEHPSNHPILFMTDVHSNYMAGLLDFMYSGQVNVKYEDLPNFLKVAEAMQIKGLHNESTSEADSDSNNNKRDLKTNNNPAHNNNNNNAKQSNLNFKHPSSPSPYMLDSYQQQQQQMLLATQQQQHFRNLMTSSPKLPTPSSINNNSNNSNNNNNSPRNTSSLVPPITSTTPSTGRAVNNASPFNSNVITTNSGNNNNNNNSSNNNRESPNPKYQIHSTSKTMLDNTKHQKYFSKRKLSSINAIADTISQTVSGMALTGGIGGNGNMDGDGNNNNTKRHKLALHHQHNSQAEVTDLKNCNKPLALNKIGNNDDDESTTTSTSNNNNNNNTVSNNNNNATSTEGGAQAITAMDQKIKMEPESAHEESTTSTTGNNNMTVASGGGGAESNTEDEVYYADSPTSNTTSTTLSAAAKLRHSILESHLRQNENSAFSGKLSFNRQTS